MLAKKPRGLRGFFVALRSFPPAITQSHGMM
jgi:hypothetical protein